MADAEFIFEFEVPNPELNDEFCRSTEVERSETIVPGELNPAVVEGAGAIDVFPNPGVADELANDATFEIDSNGFAVLYFLDSFENNSTSFPLYFSSVFSTSPTFEGLCFW